MSAPNANNPNEGIVGQAMNSINNAANYVSESIQGKSAEASKEANKQQAKGNTPNDSISDRISGAAGAVSVSPQPCFLSSSTVVCYGG